MGHLLKAVKPVCVCALVTDLEEREYGSDIFLEAHVYHPVCLVHAQVPVTRASQCDYLQAAAHT
jgi:hypothetical protein